MLLLTAVREALLGPLQSVSGIVEKRHTMPILSNVLIDKKGDALTLLATDIEIQIRTHGNAAGGEDASLTVGARKLQDILRALPDATEVSLKLDGNRLSLHGGKSRFQLQTLPATDYPRMQFNDAEAVRIVVSQKSEALPCSICCTVGAGFCCLGLAWACCGLRRCTGFFPSPPLGTPQIHHLWIRGNLWRLACSLTTCGFCWCCFG